MAEKVAILGASDKEDRYAYQAYELLREHGHEVFPVHPRLDKVKETLCFKSVLDITEPIDTLTMYVNPKISQEMADDIVKLNPKRVIFNPGTENKDLQDLLQKNNIAFEEACTLVLLRTGQY